MTGRQQFFGTMAARWDALHPPSLQAEAVARGLALVEPLDGARAVDVGCGTGILVGPLLDRLGEGRLLAIDFAPQMIAVAQARFPDPRVSFVSCDVLEAPVEPGWATHVLCYNTFPHFPEPAAALSAWLRWLAPGGGAIVWHDAPREAVARIHAGVGGAIGSDVLPPARELSLMFEAAGFTADVAHDDDRGFAVVGRRRAAPR